MASGIRRRARSVIAWMLRVSAQVHKHRARRRRRRAEQDRRRMNLHSRWRPPRRCWRSRSRCRPSSGGSTGASPTRARGRSRCSCSAAASVACGAAPRSGGTALVPALLPVRRHRQRAVPGPRHGLPALAAARGPTGGRSGSTPSPPSAPGVIVVAPLTAPIAADTLPQGSDVFGPLPRVLAAVASGVASARDHRRRGVECGPVRAADAPPGDWPAPTC